MLIFYCNLIERNQSALRNLSLIFKDQAYRNSHAYRNICSYLRIPKWLIKRNLDKNMVIVYKKCINVCLAFEK